MRSHKGELRPPRLPEFRKDSGNDGKRRKGVSLKTVPRTGGRRPCPQTEGLSKEKNKSSNGDLRRSQTNLSAPATDDTKTETRPCSGTTLNAAAGEGETERPPGRCWSPG